MHPSIQFKRTQYLYAAIAALVLMVSPPCFCEQTKSTILYIEESGLSFKELVDRISTHTGYRIDLVGEWPDDKINTQLKGVALDDGLNRIIKELGKVSYALIFDEEGRRVKIVRLVEGAAPDYAVVGKSAGLPDDEVVSPPSPSGEPGLTGRHLAAIKDNYREELGNQTGETEILPPSEYGPALTKEELEMIKRKYNLEIRAGDVDTYILPPSMNIEGDALVSPPSSKGPGLTLDELEAIKDAHREKDK